MAVRGAPPRLARHSEVSRITTHNHTVHIRSSKTWHGRPLTGACHQVGVTSPLPKRNPPLALVMCCPGRELVLGVRSGSAALPGCGDSNDSVVSVDAVVCEAAGVGRASGEFEQELPWLIALHGLIVPRLPGSSKCTCGEVCADQHSSEARARHATERCSHKVGTWYCDQCLLLGACR